MSRIMALDVGDRTIGVAVSDETATVAMPVQVLERGSSDKAVLRAIEQVARDQEVSKVVIGIPIMLDGSTGIQAGKVKAFAEKLARRLAVPVDTWDERLTTKEAERMLITADASRAKRGKVIDKLAATLILQSYLDAQGK